MQTIYELRRKLIHTGALILPLLYHTIADFLLMVILTGAFTFIAFLIEWLRLTYTSINTVFIRWFGSMLRANEQHAITAATWMAMAVFLSIWIFSKPVAIFVITAFIAGDAMASLVGQRWGRIPLFKKTFEGSLAFLVTGLLAGWLLGVLPVWIWVAGAFIMTTIECVPLTLNDNLRIPLMTGPIIEIFLWIHETFIHLSMNT